MTVEFELGISVSRLQPLRIVWLGDLQLRKLDREGTGGCAATVDEQG